MVKSYLIVESITDNSIKIVKSIDSFLAKPQVGELESNSFGFWAEDKYLQHLHNFYVVSIASAESDNGTMAEYTAIAIFLHEIISFNHHNGISYENRIDSHEMNDEYFDMLADEDTDELHDKICIYNLAKFQYQTDLAGCE